MIFLKSFFLFLTLLPPLYAETVKTIRLCEKDVGTSVRKRKNDFKKIIFSPFHLSLVLWMLKLTHKDSIPCDLLF
jgi:hypothetical protein